MGNSRKNRTHKRRSGGPLSIPELRKSFHAVEGYLAKHLTRGGASAPTDTLVGGFRKEWRKHFRRDLSVPAARSYINHMRKRKGSRSSSSSRQQGGSQLIGAPLDFDTRAGVYGQTGNYLDYVNKGFNGVTPEPGIHADYSHFKPSGPITSDVSVFAQAKGLVPTLQGGGRKRKGNKTRKNKNRRSSNQMGGLNPLTGAPYASQFRPFIAESPQTLQHSAQTAWKGLPPGPSSDPSNPAFSYKMSPHMPTIPNIDVAGLDRDLLQDVKVPY